MSGEIRSATPEEAREARLGNIPAEHRAAIREYEDALAELLVARREVERLLVRMAEAEARKVKAAGVAEDAWRRLAERSL